MECPLDTDASLSVPPQVCRIVGDLRGRWRTLSLLEFRFARSDIDHAGMDFPIAESTTAYVIGGECVCGKPPDLTLSINPLGLGILNEWDISIAHKKQRGYDNHYLDKPYSVINPRTDKFAITCVWLQGDAHAKLLLLWPYARMAHDQFMWCSMSISAESVARNCVWMRRWPAYIVGCVIRRRSLANNIYFRKQTVSNTQNNQNAFLLTCKFWKNAPICAFFHNLQLCVKMWSMFSHPSIHMHGSMLKPNSEPGQIQWCHPHRLNTLVMLEAQHQALCEWCWTDTMRCHMQSLSTCVKMIEIRASVDSTNEPMCLLPFQLHFDSFDDTLCAVQLAIFLKKLWCSMEVHTHVLCISLICFEFLPYPWVVIFNASFCSISGSIVTPR